MVDVAQLGIQVDSKPAVKAVGDLDKLTVAAGRAEEATQDLNAASQRMVPALGGVAKGATIAGNNARMMAQQLSQVAQQASATGNLTQALAIQLPDMALGFGTVGIAAGVLASVALPMLVSWLGDTSAEATAATEALKALAQAQIDTQGEIDKLRFGVDESYQVELLKEQIRLRDEYAAKYAEAARIAATFGNDERARTQYIADSRSELDKMVARYDEIGTALSQQQNRSAQLAVLEGVKAQRAGEMAAKQRDAAAESAKVYDALRNAGIAASTLAGMNFGNIDQARAFAEGLATAMASAANYASLLGNTGQASGPDAVRTQQFGGGKFAAPVRGAGLPALSGSGAGGGGGGGGGGGSDPFADNLKSLVENLRSEREIEDEWYQENLAILNDRRAQEILGQQGHQEALIALHQEYQNRIAEIDAEAQQRRIGDTANLFGALASVAQAGGQKMAKAAAAFQAIEGTVNAYGAAIKALNTPGITLAGRFAAYASVLAAGLKGVAAIRQAGGVGGGGGGGAVAQGATAAAVQRSSELTINVDPNALLTATMWSQIFEGVVGEAKARGMTNFTGIRFA